MPDAYHGSTLESLFEELGEADEFRKLAELKINKIKADKKSLAKTVELLATIKRWTPGCYIETASRAKEDYTEHLLELVETTQDSNWDLDASSPIEIDTWNRAFELLLSTIEYQLTSQHNNDYAFVSPCSDGSVHLNWISRGIVTPWVAIRVEVWPDKFLCCKETQEDIVCDNYVDVITFLQNELLEDPEITITS